MFVWAKKNGYCLGLKWLPWMEPVLHPQLWGERTTGAISKKGTVKTQRKWIDLVWLGDWHKNFGDIIQHNSCCHDVNANFKDYNSYIVLVPRKGRKMQRWWDGYIDISVKIQRCSILGPETLYWCATTRNPNWQRTTIVRSRLNMYWSQWSARKQPGNQTLRLRARVWQRWSKMIIIMTTIIYLLIREHWTYIYATKPYTISHHIITCPSYHSIPSKVIISYVSSFQVYLYYIYICMHIYIYIICHISYQFPSVPIGSHQFPSAQPPECIATQDSKPGGKPSKMARFNMV